MLNRKLPEEVALNNIRGEVLEAGVNFDASQIGSADEREQGAKSYAKSYREALNKAVTEVGIWEEVVQAKVEQIEIGRGKVTIPKPDDPYWKLHKKAIPFIIDLRKRRDEMQN